MLCVGISSISWTNMEKLEVFRLKIQVWRCGIENRRPKIWDWRFQLENPTSSLNPNFQYLILKLGSPMKRRRHKVWWIHGRWTDINNDQHFMDVHGQLKCSPCSPCKALVNTLIVSLKMSEKLNWCGNELHFIFF